MIHTDENGRLHLSYTSIEDNGDSALISLACEHKSLVQGLDVQKRLKALGLRWIQLTFGIGHLDVVNEEWAESLVSMNMARYVE